MFAILSGAVTNLLAYLLQPFVLLLPQISDSEILTCCSGAGSPQGEQGRQEQGGLAGERLP